MNTAKRDNTKSTRRCGSTRRLRGVGLLFSLATAVVGVDAPAADAPRNPRLERPIAAPGPRLLTPASMLQASIGYTKIQVITDQPLAYARGGLVPLGIKYTGVAPIASVQVPGALSYPIGPFTGSFEHTIANADARALLARDEAQILARCRSTLDANQVDIIDTVHDATIPFTVNAADGSVAASTNVVYQLGLTCKHPLAAKLGYAKIELDINRSLAQAKGGLVPLTISYDGMKAVSSVQVPGSLSYPIGPHQGSFDQTLPNADIRAVLKRDEATIVARCKSTLEYNNATAIDTVHDSRIPVTVNAADGAVIASTTVRYQLGLTCRR